MNHPLSKALAIAIAVSAAGCATTVPPDDTPATEAPDTAMSNPFFTESQLPLHYPRFDQIEDSHFAPAFDRGMAEHLAEVEAIANNPAAPTFDNTIIPLE